MVRHVVKGVVQLGINSSNHRRVSSEILTKGQKHFMPEEELVYSGTRVERHISTDILPKREGARKLEEEFAKSATRAEKQRQALAKATNERIALLDKERDEFNDKLRQEIQKYRVATERSSKHTSRALIGTGALLGFFAAIAKPKPE